MLTCTELGWQPKILILWRCFICASALRHNVMGDSERAHKLYLRGVI